LWEEVLFIVLYDKQMKHFMLMFLVFSSFLSCNEKEFEAPLDQNEYGYDYYPLELGQIRVYKVDSILFDVGSGNLPVRDSSTVYIREEIVEVLSLPEADLLQVRVERQIADEVGGPWKILDVVTRARSTNQGYYSESNVQLINLVFPLRKGVRWNGTAFVAQGLPVFVLGSEIEMYKGWDFQVTDEGIAESVGEEDYSEVATIVQSANENLIELRNSIEKYARGVGLVYRQREIVDSYCKYESASTYCNGLDWIDKASRGFFTREVLVDVK